MGLEHKYCKSMAERWYLRLKTRLPGHDNYDGVVTHTKRGFIVLREARDFEWDGLIVLPKNVIKGYRDNKYEKCANAIIRHSGSFKQLRVPGWLDACNTIRDVLIGLKQRDIWPGIEMFVNDRTETAFYLGPITGIEANTFCVKCYDAAGEWEQVIDPSDDALGYDAVGRIEFDSKYCNSFNAYMRSKTVF